MRCKMRHFLYSEVPSSFLVNTVQTLSKSVYNSQSYWQKFRGTFLYGPLCKIFPRGYFFGTPCTFI